MREKKDNNSNNILVNSIKESIKGPSYFAEIYWEHIEEGGNPDEF